jgi:UDPglucose--hexose-1-phosphate uridylyltransferase
MRVPDLTLVVDVWAAQYTELGRHPGILRADLRESRRDDGRQQSASALPDLGQPAAFPPRWPPNSAQQAAWRAERGSCLLCDYLALEREAGERLVCENESFAALVPFWAVWPFETMIVSKRHLTGMDEFDEAERGAWPIF